ncbi:MAG: recombinase family protein [Bacteroidota bacterium]
MFNDALATTKRRAAVYVRVSTVEQKVDGYGTEAQKRHIVSYFKIPIALLAFQGQSKSGVVFDDVHTGALIGRPALNKFLNKAINEKKYDTIVIWKIDRLSRNLQDLLTVFERLRKHNIGLISIQENIDFHGTIGTLIFQMFGAIAQFERSLIHERTYSGRVASATIGNYTGTSVPYGYRAIRNENGKGKKLTIIEEEKKWVAKMFSWYNYKGLGFRQIAKKLNDLAVPRGRDESRARSVKWTENIISGMLKNPVYKGEYVAIQKDSQGKSLPTEEWVVVRIPNCISEFTFLLAQQTRKEKVGQRKAKHFYLLAGLLKDATTYKPFSFKGRPNTKYGGRSYNRSKVIHPETGEVYPNFSLPAQAIEDCVWEMLLRAFRQPEAFITRHVGKNGQGEKHRQFVEAQLQKVRARKAEFDLRLRRIEDAYEAGAYSLAVMSDRKDRLNADSVFIEQEIDRLERELEDTAMTEKQKNDLRVAAKKVDDEEIDKLDYFGKKALIHYYVDHIKVTRRRHPGEKKYTSILTVFFRFLPDSERKANDICRTRFDDTDHEKQASFQENTDHGERAHSRYNRLLIPCTFSLRYQSDVKRTGKKVWVHTRLVAVPA